MWEGDLKPSALNGNMSSPLAARPSRPTTTIMNCTLISAGSSAFIPLKGPADSRGRPGSEALPTDSLSPKHPVTALQKFTSHKGTSDRAKFHAVVPGLPGGFWTETTALK